MSTDWTRKLLAFLHDPPEKAYDYGPEHKQRVQAYVRRLLGAEASWNPAADHAAAAADRFIFPCTRRRDGDHWVETGVSGLGNGVVFRHPLHPAAVICEQFPDQGDAMDMLSAVFPDFPGVPLREAHWLLWRCWLPHAVTHKAGQRQGAGWLAYLPADTRISDGSIWHHNAVVSAIEGALAYEGSKRPALLLFQVGPVQEFIAQARSTRDLWSGSYLLSWMMAHAIKTLTDQFGPDAVIFPSLRGQPLFDWLHRELLEAATFDTDSMRNFWTSLGLEKVQELAITPSFPNRFLAVVPENIDTGGVIRVFDYAQPGSEWRRIADACWNYLGDRAPLPSGARELWEQQASRFWQITWQLWPFVDVDEALVLANNVPLGTKSSLLLGRDVAMAIPDAHKDMRCYTGDPKQIREPAWAWNVQFDLLAHRLDARRQTRDFAAWSVNAPAHKDYFSGKEEVIATDAWLQQARRDATLQHLFRSDDELGAVNLIKRVWHKAYLEHGPGFNHEAFRFESVLSIAAGPWRRKVLNAIAEGGDAWRALLDFEGTVKNAESILDFELPAARTEAAWLRRVDAGVFQESFWRNLTLTGEAEEGLRDKALNALQALIRAIKGAVPTNYYAVIALDGDQIGKWLSGEKTPTVGEVITDKAAAYFRKHVTTADVERWMKSNRPLSPSYHLQFSEALANFGLYCARRIVEAHHGQLIYSGGDDVLAMLPASEAISCAQGLRLAFQGRSKELVAQDDGRYAHLFHADMPLGFIRLRDGDWDRGCRSPAEPSWPLLVPGPRATVSVGISIGHIKEPLQDMVQEAQAAEKRAKNELDRNALAVTLFKRSGETIHWGCKFTNDVGSLSRSLALLVWFQPRYRAGSDASATAPPISGRFPYRIAELLQRYRSFTPPTSDSTPRLAALDEGLKNIASREVAWVIQQQCGGLSEAGQAELLRLCEACLAELQNHGRPLEDFWKLFAVEAFIGREGN